MRVQEARYYKKRTTRREKCLEKKGSASPLEAFEVKNCAFLLQTRQRSQALDPERDGAGSLYAIIRKPQRPSHESALYKVESLKRFAGLRLSGPVPNETMILKFRHLLEQHELYKVIIKEVNRHLEK